MQVDVDCLVEEVTIASVSSPSPAKALPQQRSPAAIAELQTGAPTDCLAVTLLCTCLRLHLCCSLGILVYYSFAEGHVLCRSLA